MRHLTVFVFVYVGIGFFLAAATTAQETAQETAPDQRIAFDQRWTRDADWETAESLQLFAAEGQLELIHHGAETGWAAPTTRWMFDQDATLSVHVAELGNAEITVQAEWMAADGRFLGAANVIDRITESDVRLDVKLTPLLPKTSSDQPQPTMMRLKLWMGGDGGKAVIDELTVHSPRRWQDKKIKTVTTMAPTAKLTPDEGMIAAPEHQTLAMKLKSPHKFAGLVMGEAVPFDLKSAVMLDVSWLTKGRVSLQAVCFDPQGRHIGEVDLMKEIDQPGLYEAPLSIYRSQFPEQVKTIQFKLWLGGAGAETRVAGIRLGAAP